MVAEFGTGQVFWSVLWFFLFFIWMMLLFQVFGDIFGSPDLSGLSKTLWSLFVIIFPYLGVFVYFIVRGRKMQEHAAASAAARDAAQRQYIRSAVDGSSSAADELAKLAQLKENGTIDDREFSTLKANIMGGT